MAGSPRSKRWRLASFADALQARGRYVFTRADAERAGWRSAGAARAALRRLKANGRVVSPRRGFHVLVPVEYRSAGAPPASWFVDDLMKHLGQPYYVGILSAAVLHGAAHQQPMSLQVVTDRPTRPVEVGRVRIEFHVRRDMGAVAATAMPTETGSMQVSTPEMTAFDLVRFAPVAGSWSNVATVLSELAERLDPARLVRLAAAFAVPDAQRLGFVLDRLGERRLADPLAEWLSSRRLRPAVLSTRRSSGRHRPDPRFRVVANVALESDR